MLSYQHAYHAGNAADVHKHLALALLLEKLRQKDKPFCVVDAHAGRGLYDLDGAEAHKTGEAETGIRRLAAIADPPLAVAALLGLIERCNQPGQQRYYPGTPKITQLMLRENDRAVLLELHPQDVAALKHMVGGDRRMHVHARDSYKALPGLLPPAERRGIVLLDPSYEVKTEYVAIVDLLEQVLARWATGICLLWYPLLPDQRHRRMLRALDALTPDKTLLSEFRFARDVAGLQGSGLVIVNAPWQFDETLAAAMPVVAAAIADAGSGAYTQRWLGAH